MWVEAAPFKDVTIRYGAKKDSIFYEKIVFKKKYFADQFLKRFITQNVLFCLPYFVLFFLRISY